MYFDVLKGPWVKVKYSLVKLVLAQHKFQTREGDCGRPPVTT